MKFVKFNKVSGGQIIVPVDEIGVVSTLLTMVGEAWEMDETKALIYVRTLGSVDDPVAQVAVDHSVEYIYNLLVAI